MIPSPTSLLSYVQLLDSALPIGGFSHSFGLETFVQRHHVTTLQQLEQYIAGQIHSSIVPMDAITISCIYKALHEYDDKQIAQLDSIFHTQRSPRETRDGMHKMGRRLIKLGKSLYPEAKLDELEQLLTLHGGYGTFPVVFTWITWHLDIDVDTAVHGYLYTSIQTMVNSGIRLMSMGQTDGQLLIRRMQQYATEEWSELCKHSISKPFSFSAVHDILAMEHETLYSRLFMS